MNIRTSPTTLSWIAACLLAFGSQWPMVTKATAALRTEGPFQAASRPVRVWQDSLTLPTYEEDPPDPNPPFDYFKPRRLNYPYTLRTNLTDRRAPRAWRALNLENEYLQCTVLAELGGHLYGCRDKINNAEVFYANPSIKLAQIAYRGAWAAFGVEFNFPVSHNWMTTSPVDFAMTTGGDGSASIWIGNIDRVYGMQWRVRLTLRPGRAVLEQHTTLYNRSDFRHRYYWWTNAAAQVWDDSRIIYPMQFTAGHGFRDIDTWPIDSSGVDLSVVGNHTRGSVSRFSHASREPYMAVYHPRTQAGVVHYADYDEMPGKKIWSWGSDARGLGWRKALSDNNSAYVEIQRGLFRDQETYGYLEPQQSVSFTEYWIPFRWIGGVSRANPEAVIYVAREGVPSEGDWHEEAAASADSAYEEGVAPAGGGPEQGGDLDQSPGPLRVALNVTRQLPDARIVLLLDGKFVTRQRVDLTPSALFTATYPDLTAPGSYTVELRDSADTPLLSHTEGQYSFTPTSQIQVGARPQPERPAADARSENDWLAIGDDQERNGRRLEAQATYRDALSRFPDSRALHMAAGRLNVVLKQYEAAEEHLRAAAQQPPGQRGIDTAGPASSDAESAYYLGHSLLARGDGRGARQAWELSRDDVTFAPAARLSLAAQTARTGDRGRALEILERLIDESPYSVRAGSFEVALLRRLGRPQEARTRLRHWLDVDPTSSFLRYEDSLLGDAGISSAREEVALWSHLAADPERILEIVVDYMRLGLWADALALLDLDYPSGVETISEPSMPRPEEYPLIGYYRGYLREAMGRSGAADYDAASRMSTKYVFPNRPESFAVLEAALRHNPDDATAHFLLGSLHLSGGMPQQAMHHWETARRLNPRIPVLHRNMGYTLLNSGDPERATELFVEGTTVDGRNIGLYFGLDEAMRQTGEPPGKRADALLRFPDPEAMPAALVYEVARALTAAERFDEADWLFYGRFFPSEEGGTDVRQVYLEVKLARADALVERGNCLSALVLLDNLSEEVLELPFTADGLETLIGSPPLAQRIAEVRRACSFLD